uniref:Aspartoacylase n=1 Tax=Alexandrium catenella TaxID=2925 RepID=A0A7S1RVB5_ALECA|mmetsp:Transcript_74872/g.198904  ORF Transcript_74872/g.198904 Transcript_74872/m.198904 type:complete len:329 (+) Transcript_74872:95-1081(+)
MAAMDWKKRRTLPGAAVKRVAIVGGTHGNETNGVQLAKHFMRNLGQVQRPSFATEVLLANTFAIEANTRYVDEDLNRCYLLADLTDDAKAETNRERKRAREIDQVLGPKSSDEPRCDLVIDLHNTTASTDIALLMAPDDEFSHQIAYYLKSLDSGVRIIHWNPLADWALCPSVGRSGMTFEVGACPWGCLVPDLFMRSQKLVLAALDYVESHNKRIASGGSIGPEVSMPVFKAIGVSIDYPRNEEGELLGMVHQDLQGGDFKELSDGVPLFQRFDGEVVAFSREEHKVPEQHKKVFALFVNEAAYYEKKMALMLVSQEEAKFSMSVEM